MMAAFWKRIAAFLCLSLSSSIYARGSLPPPCDSRIYCHGPLLHTVQMANLGGNFSDSKYFVDMPLLQSPSSTLAKFSKLIKETNNNPTTADVAAFVKDSFSEPGEEFVDWVPDDWVKNPEFLAKIVDTDLQEWGRDLNELWKELGRKINTTVRDIQNRYSLIYVTHPFIVPGGRFRETYYWDSYWTLEGLLLSEMDATVKGMLENFFEMVRTYGFVPNGGRIYYTRRSQPPYLISMAKLYYDYSGDIEFIENNIHLLEKEFQFWSTNRSRPVRGKSGKIYNVYQYDVEVDLPRPEGYKEDYKVAENLTYEEDKQRMYVQLKSGAESGWDFSTRWFVKGDSNRGDLSDLNVTAIAPVDLNSLMCRNARILSELYSLIDDTKKATFYSEIARERNQTLAELFWDEDDGIWYDLNVHTKNKRRFFYLSNVHPLWSDCYGLEGNRKDTVMKVLNYLNRTKVIDYIGGVPTSKRNSGEQWDYPNAWAPLQHHVIMGLHYAAINDLEAENLAFELAEKWIRSNYAGYKETDLMFEKYDVNDVGAPGSGGEYETVPGFGWTNGVAMKLLDTFGDRLTATTGGASGNVAHYSLFVQLLLTFIFVNFVP